MPHAFDLRNFARIFDDVERLVPRTRVHERELARLAGLIEGSGHAERPARDRLAWQTELPAIIGELLATARQQHQLAESIATRLLGANGDGDEALPRQTRVLIVDDSPDNRDLAATVLESSGFKTITASNGLDAIVAAHCVRPAVILMDLMMPVLDGLEAARLIRASAVTHDAQLLAYTARPDFADRALMKLFAGVLTKPATPEVMVRTVRAVLDTGHSSPAGPSS